MRKTERWFPAGETFHRIGRVKREIHRQWAAGHLPNQRHAARIGLGDGLQVIEYGTGIGGVVQQGSNHHWPA